MSSWREEILKEFTPQVARLTLVADPDGLLLEEGILKGIEERGFDLIPFEDHVAFRYAYESRYRERWDRGEMTDLVVVLRASAPDLRLLPYDLLQAGRKLSFSLAELFPNLSLRIVEALERGDIDALHEAQAHERIDRPLGDNQTSSFVLRHVFKVAPETIRDSAGLLSFLLERHYKGLNIPGILDDYLIETLARNGNFGAWLLNVIVPDREAFIAFLQERWPIFLDRTVSTGEPLRTNRIVHELEITGPRDLPFDHPDVRVYIDNLFLEGMLEPVPHASIRDLALKWTAVGVRVDAAQDHRDRWERLVETVRGTIPSVESRHQEWQSFAPRWAQLMALRHGLDAESLSETRSSFEELRDRVDEAFLTWTRERFDTLHNQPASPPVMVHQIPRLLARHLEETRTGKVALLVMDGLAFDQWVVLHAVLRGQRAKLWFREGAVFAWIPTLTMVSRQACFAGRPPLYFPASIHTTDKEPRAWTRFWEDEGLTPTEIGYEKNIRDLPDLERVEQVVSHPRIRAIGLVVDKVDRIMHGMELGSAGMHNQVRQWAEQGMLAGVLDILMKRGFKVWLTADHGNIEASGCGRPAEGSTADLRGERVRVYSDFALRARVHERFPDAIAWPPTGLPQDYLPLIAPRREAFVRQGDALVGHGGVTVEEVIVPFVRIEQR